MLHYQQESSQGYHDLSVEALMLKQGVITLSGEVGSEMNHSFFESMWYLNQNPEIREIKLILDSPGGSVQDGLAMIDMIRNSKKKVVCIVAGMAYSMGAVILAASNERLILPNSKVMIHEPSLMRAGGNASSMRETAEDLIKTNELLCSLLAECTGHTKEEVEQLVQKDHYFTAKEAVEFGICDRIAETNDLWSE